MTKALTALLHSVMLTLEVVRILRKAIILISALALAVCSHLRPVCDFTVAGRRIESRCTPAAAKAAREAALMAAEEILPGRAEAVEASRQLRFSFRPGADIAPGLGDALLRAQDGVAAASCVYVDGQYLGAVADSAEFQSGFSMYIGNTLPTWAKGGSVRGLSLVPRYTRAENIVPNDDMILLVTGLSPVMYYDGKGRVSPV